MGQLGLLMDYTVFHIGVYITLGTGILGVEALKKIDHWSLRWAMGFLLAAGLAGGTIAGNIPHYTTFNAFTEAKLSFLGQRFWSYSVWAILEHGFFWTAIVVPSVTFLRWGKDPFTLK